MKKYQRLICTVCQRITDKLVDDTRFTPDKCTITMKCEGRLTLLEYRSNAGITSAPVIGVPDWRARNTVVSSTAATAATTFVNTSTGNAQQVILAVQLSDAQAATATSMKLSLNERVDTPKAFRQYVYRFDSAFSTVAGVESGIEKKVLRYSSTDTVEVYLNGVKLVQGTASDGYQVYDGTGSNGVPSNTVNLNSVISLPGITQVDVIVSAAVITVPVELTFARMTLDESRKGTGSWENVGSVKMYNGVTKQSYYLFYLDLSEGAALKLNSILTPNKLYLNGITDIGLTPAHLLLARSPYTNLDRYTNLTVPLGSMNFDAEYLKYHLVDGVTTLQITAASVSAKYPPLEVQKFTTELTIKTATTGVTNQVVLDESVIVGPDA